MGTVVQTITTTGTTNWVAPGGVTTVQVELWGAGGTGGPATGTASGAGGGAGGQYAKKQVTVVPGNTYAVVVPAAATATTSVVNGADATFAATTVVAKGGAGAVAATGATGAGASGSTTSGVGDTVFAGGNGATGVSSTSSGGGGSGAGSTGTGNNGSAGTGGAAKASNGGAGGNGVTTANTRNAGSNYGGGGSGGLSSSATDRAGGNGAQGLAVLTYTLPATETITDNFSTKDTAKWTWGGTADAVSGQLVLPANASYTSRITGKDATDFTGSYAAAELVSIPASCDTAISCFNTVDATDAEELWYLAGAGNVLAFRELVNNVQDQTTLTYDPVAHRWVQIREAGGTIFWETSPNGMAGTWTTRRSKTKSASVDVTNVGVMFVSGGGVANNAIWDNCNLLPAAGTSLVPPVRRPNYGSLIQM